MGARRWVRAGGASRSFSAVRAQRAARPFRSWDHAPAVLVIIGLLLLTVALLAAAPAAQAGPTAYIWDGGGDGLNWSDGMNWNYNTPPYEGASLEFPSPEEGAVYTYGECTNDGFLTSVGDVTIGTESRENGISVGGSAVAITGSLTGYGTVTWAVESTTLFAPLTISHVPWFPIPEDPPMPYISQMDVTGDVEMVAGGTGYALIVDSQYDSSGTIRIQGQIHGDDAACDFTVIGGGNVTVGDAAWAAGEGNTWAGATTIASGKLTAVAPGALPDGTPVAMNQGAYGFAVYEHWLYDPSIVETLDNVFSGDGRLTLARGHLTLTGDSSGFTGECWSACPVTLAATAKLGGQLGVGTGGIVRGTGTAGELKLYSGGIVSPADSDYTVGTLKATGDVTWSAGGSYAVDMSDAFAGQGLGYDHLNILGSLDVHYASAETPFTIELRSGSGGVPGPAGNFFANMSYGWDIASVKSAVIGLHADDFVVDTSQFVNALSGSFSVETHVDEVDDSTVVELVYTPHDVHTWTGGGTTGQWSDADNWDIGVPSSGDSLVFPAGVPTVSENDLTGLTLRDVTFTGGGYDVAGNAITLSGDVTDKSSVDEGNTLEPAITFSSAAHVFTVDAGTLTLEGDLDGGPSTGAVIEKAGGGTLELAGAAEYSGGLDLQAGTLKPTAPQAVPGSAPVHIADAATFSCEFWNFGSATLGGDLTGPEGASLHVNRYATLILSGDSSGYLGLATADTGGLGFGLIVIPEGQTFGGRPDGGGAISGAGTIPSFGGIQYVAPGLRGWQEVGSLYWPILEPTTLHTSGSTSWHDGQILGVVMEDATGAPGVGHDQVVVAGDVAMEEDGSMVVAVVGDSGGTIGPCAGFDPAKPQSWHVLRATGTITGFDDTDHDVATMWFPNDLEGGAFSLALATQEVDGTSYQTVDLVFTPAPDTHTWDGEGANGLWSNPLNWVDDALPSNGDDLVFPATANKDTTDDLLTSVRTVTFTNGGYEVESGGPVTAVTVTGDAAGIGSAAGVGGSVFWRVPLALGADATFSVGAGAVLYFDGSIDLGTNQLTTIRTGAGVGSGLVGFNGVISGRGKPLPDAALQISGHGTDLTVYLGQSNTYSGKTLIDGALVSVAGDDAIKRCTGADDPDGASYLELDNGAALNLNDQSLAVNMLVSDDAASSISNYNCGTALLTVGSDDLDHYDGAQYDGTVDSSVELVKDGTTAQTFAGSLSHSGKTSVEDGILHLDGRTAGQAIADLIVLDPGTLQVDGGVDDPTLTTGAATGDGTVSVTSGRFRVSGDGSAFTGHTSVSPGALLYVAGSLKGPMLQYGVLGGDGTVGDVAVGNDGTVAPSVASATSSPTGPMRLFTGALSLEAGSTYACRVGDADGIAGSGYDALRATSLATSSGKDEFVTIALDSVDGKSQGPCANWDETRAYRWTVIESLGACPGLDDLKLDTTAFEGQNDVAGGAFSLERVLDAGFSTIDVVFTPASSDTHIWDGEGGADDQDWSTALNWVGDTTPENGDSLAFPAGSGTVAINDSFLSEVDAIAVGHDMTASGSAVSLSGEMTLGRSSAWEVTTTLEKDVRVLVTVTSTPTPEAILGGDIQLLSGTTGGHTLNVTNMTGSIRHMGKLIGADAACGLVKAGPGSLVLGVGSKDPWTGENTWAGPTDVQEGSLIIASPGALSSHSDVRVASGATVSASFDDATATDVWSSVFTGNGHVDVESGAVTMTAASGSFFGRVDVFEGSALTLTGSFPADTNADGLLRGTGTLGALDARGSLSPGVDDFEVGTLSGGGMGMLYGGARYVCDVGDVAELPGVGYDLLHLSGDAVFSETTEHPFTIVLRSGNGGSEGPAAGFDKAKPYRWQALVSATSIRNFGAEAVAVDASAFVARNPVGTGAFSLEVTSHTGYQTLDVVYTPGADTHVWDGGGSNDKWSTAANWVDDIAPKDGDLVRFSGVTRQLNTNDFLTTVSGIEFANGGWVITGDALATTGSVTSEATSGTVWIQQAITLKADAAMTSADGGELVILQAHLNDGAAGHGLTIGGLGTVYLTGIDGAGADCTLTKTGGGTSGITGPNTFGGAVTVAQGTLRLLDTKAIPAGVPVGIADSATLWVQSASGDKTFTLDNVFTGASRATLTVWKDTLQLTGDSPDFAGSLQPCGGGTLRVDGKILGKIQPSDGLITGIGTIGGMVLSNDGIFSPGRSDYAIGGIRATGNVELMGESTYRFDVANADGDPGQGYDNLRVEGPTGCIVASLAGWPFAVVLRSSDESGPAEAASFDPSRTYRWHLVTATTGSITQFAADKFTLDATGFTNDLEGGSFSLALSTDGKSIDVVFTPGPPNTHTWDGGGADDNWSTAANWVGDKAPRDGDSLVFPSLGTVVKHDTVNDLLTSAHTITFTSDYYYVVRGSTSRPELTLSGDGAGCFIGPSSSEIDLRVALKLAQGATITNAAGVCLLYGDVTLEGDASLDVTGGTCEVHGDVDVGTHQLTIAGSASAAATSRVNLYGAISGRGKALPDAALDIVGTSRNLSVSVATAQVYSGKTRVDGAIVNLQAVNAIKRCSGAADPDGASFLELAGAATVNSSASQTFNLIASSDPDSLYTGDSLTLGSDDTDHYDGRYDGKLAGLVLYKTGATTQTLGGANTYVQPTFVNGGVLRIAAPGALPGASRVVFDGLETAVLEARFAADTTADTWPNTIVQHGTLRVARGVLTTTGANSPVVHVDVQAGATLIQTGSFSSSVTRTGVRGTLRGTGGAGALAPDDGGVVSPGVSDFTEGTLTTGTLTLGLGGGEGTAGRFVCDVGDVAQAAGAGYDELVVTRTSLDPSVVVTTTAAKPFTVALRSGSGGTEGPAAGFNDQKAYRFEVLRTTGAVSGFTEDDVVVDTSAFEAQNPLGGGSFSLALTDHTTYRTIDVVFTPAQNTHTWDGGGSDALWSTPENWVGDVAPRDGDDLVFAGSTQETNENDLLGSVRNVTFTGGDFIISGDPLELSGVLKGEVGTSSTTWDVTTTLGADATLQSDGDGLNISGVVHLADGATGHALTVTGTGDTSLTGGIDGAGSACSLTKQGTGQLTLRGTNTFGGAVIVSAGSLWARGAQALPADVPVSIDADAELVASSTGKGGGGAGTWNNVLSGAGSLTVYLDHLRLTGMSPAFTGPTTVDYGTLVVDGRIDGPVTLADGGTLGGNGIVAGAVETTSGLLWPGAVDLAPATLSAKAATLAGDSGSRFCIASASGASGSYDQLDTLELAVPATVTHPFTIRPWSVAAGAEAPCPGWDADAEGRWHVIMFDVSSPDPDLDGVVVDAAQFAAQNDLNGGSFSVAPGLFAGAKTIDLVFTPCADFTEDPVVGDGGDAFAKATEQTVAWEMDGAPPAGSVFKVVADDPASGTDVLLATVPATSATKYSHDWTIDLGPSAGWHVIVQLWSDEGTPAVELRTADSQDFDILAASYTITVTAGAHGGITPGTGPVTTFDDKTYTITPATGYHVADVTVDSVSKGAVTSYEFKDVRADHTIAATFAADRFEITPSVIGTSARGSISPATAQTVDYGATPKFTFAPDPNYHVKEVKVDGSVVTMTGTNEYTFPAVTRSQAITVEFTIDQYQITVAAGAHGSITPGSGPVDYGSSPTYTITPDQGCHITGVTADGKSLGVVGSVTFKDVTETHTLSATFALDTYEIEPSVVGGAGGHGAITPASTQTVEWHSTPTFAFTPEAGWEVDEILVDGESVEMTGDNEYTFAPVTEGHAISVSFAPMLCTITVTAGAHGAVTPGTGIVAWDASPTYVIAPDAGFRIGDVAVDGAPIGPVTSYQFVSVRADHTLEATFVAEGMPTTSVTGAKAGWSKRPVTLTLAGVPAPGGSPIAFTEYRVGGGAWVRGSSVTIRTQGPTVVEYRSQDTAGGLQDPPGRCTVRVDTRKPRVVAKSRTAHPGRTIRLKYRVKDPVPGSGSALVRAVVRNAEGRVMTRSSAYPVAVDKWLKLKISTHVIHAWGTYTVSLRAKDAAGNWQKGWTKVRLTIR